MIHKCNASFNLVITGLRNELHRNFPLCSEIGDFFIAVSTIKAISDLTWKYLLPYQEAMSETDCCC